MAQTTAQRKRNQRARDRARLGDTEYKRIEAEKMRAYRARKNPRPKRTTIINNQPQPVQQVQQQQSAQQQAKARKKAPQQFQRYKIMYHFTNHLVQRHYLIIQLLHI